MRSFRQWAFLGCGVAWLCLPARVEAIPVFARVYNKPCGTCHTVFPQLNPAGEDFRAHGLHGIEPAIAPWRIGSQLEVPGTLPLALYLTSGVDVTRTDAPGQSEETTTHLNLQFLKLLAGGELGRHLAFLVDYELVEMEPDSGEVTINTLPYQAYLVAHAARGGWLANLKGGWYELPLGTSPEIHRLSVRPYLVYGLTGCALLGAPTPRDGCDDEPMIGELQVGTELSVLRPDLGLGLATGFTNGSNTHLSSDASKDFFLRATQMIGPHRIGLFLFYGPDVVGHGFHDHTVRIGPDLDLYTRQLHVLGQFLANYESNPTDRSTRMWYYGGFLEAQYRLTTALVSLLRIDYAWSPRFDDTDQGGTTRSERRLWEATAGAQWLALENIKLIAEVTYGEDHDIVQDHTTRTWAGTFRLATAFWPFAPPGIDRWLNRERTP